MTELGDVSKYMEVQSVKTTSILTLYLVLRTIPRYLTISSERSPILSTVRYNDLTWEFPNPYSLRMESSDNILSNLFTEIPVISTELATKAMTSFEIFSPWSLFRPSKKSFNPVSENTDSTRSFVPQEKVRLSFGNGTFAWILLLLRDDIFTVPAKPTGLRTVTL